MIKFYLFKKNTTAGGLTVSTDYYFKTDKTEVNFLNIKTIPVSELLEISEGQYNLHETHGITTPETNPDTGNAWTNEQEKQAWISKQLIIEGIKAQGKGGQFALNITFIQGIMDFLFKLAAHENLFASNPNVNDRMVDNLDADYLIEASQLNRGAIDEFKFETKTMLTILFTRLEQNNSEHLTGKIDKLYLELIELLKEFEDIDIEADLPKQLIAILEKIHKAFTPQTVNNGHTLSSEMPVAAGGTQVKK